MRQTIKEVIFLPSFYYIDKLRASALVQLDNKCLYMLPYHRKLTTIENSTIRNTKQAACPVEVHHWMLNIAVSNLNDQTWSSPSNSNCRAQVDLGVHLSLRQRGTWTQVRSAAKHGANSELTHVFISLSHFNLRICQHNISIYHNPWEINFILYNLINQ